MDAKNKNQSGISEQIKQKKDTKTQGSMNFGTLTHKDAQKS